MIIQKEEKLRVLDFDIENRPLSYLGFDFTTAEITAIACGWVGEEKVNCWLLGVDDPVDILQNFVKFYDMSDAVTGHYIRKHDLPIINGALMEYELPLLREKLTFDTKLDLRKRKDISASQESLAGMYELEDAKHHMSQPEWRKANRLTEEGIKQTKKRVIDDVKQHKALREKLISMNALGPGKVWRP